MARKGGKSTRVYENVRPGLYNNQNVCVCVWEMSVCARAVIESALADRSTRYVPVLCTLPLLRVCLTLAGYTHACVFVPLA